MNKLLFLGCLCISLSLFGQYQPAPSFFRTKRPAPLVDLNTTSTILVSDFGAVINDGKDDRVAIQNAISAAAKAGTASRPVKLLFEKGTYDLMPTDSLSHSISMTDANGLLWDGQNAEFLIHNPTVGFLSLLRCRNTIIKDISVDYAKLPFTQGVVTKVDPTGGFFEFRVDDNFPLPVEAHFMSAPERWGMIKNPQGGIKKGTPNLIPHIRFFESIGPRTYRYVQSSSILNTISVGDYFVQIARNNGKTIIQNNTCKNLSYISVTAFASPSGGFNAFNSEEWHILNCQIKMKQGRVQSTNADCIHVNGGAIAPWVENCLFEGFSDDCLNLKYLKREITTIHGPTQITVNGSVLNGETLEFYNPREGVLIGTAKVTLAENMGSNRFRLTLSNPVNITTVTSVEHQLADKVYIENRSNESFIFRNNIIRNSRRYGILIQNKYALIENNLFQNLSGAGISIQNGVDWGEGFRASEIEIRNNRFENCGFDTDYISSNNTAAIIADFSKLGSPCSTDNRWCGTLSTDWQAHNNIRILDNKISFNKRGLYLKNINGLVVSGNVICHNPEDITLLNGGSPVTQTILNTSNASVQNYKAEVPNAIFQFKMNELNVTSEIPNSGTNVNVSLKINTRGGEITGGFKDSLRGNTFKINTAGNGELRLINSATGVSASGPVGGAARTYSFWIKPNQAIFQNLIYSGGPTNGEVFAVQMQADRVLRVTDNNLNFVRMADMPLDIGKWNHIVITMPENGTIAGIALYKNGVPSKVTLSGTNAPVKTSNNSVDFFNRFDGLVSDIRYFDYNLCSGEVESVFQDKLSILSSNETIAGEKDKILVFPTLASNILYFNQVVKSVEVFDLFGKKMILKDSGEIKELDISNLPSGLYMIKLNRTETTKFYKN